MVLEVLPAKTWRLAKRAETFFMAFMAFMAFIAFMAAIVLRGEKLKRAAKTSMK